MKTPLAFALLVAFLNDTSPAHLLKPEDAIKIRQGGKLFLSWSMTRISDMTVTHSVPYDQETVMRSAQAVAALANSGWGSLYGPGTEKSYGDIKTRVKPEYFQQTDDVRQLTRSFVTEASLLAQVAAQGDQVAIRAQLERTSETCRKCHEKYRSKA